MAGAKNNHGAMVWRLAFNQLVCRFWVVCVWAVCGIEAFPKVYKVKLKLKYILYTNVYLIEKIAKFIEKNHLYRLYREGYKWFY